MSIEQFANLAPTLTLDLKAIRRPQNRPMFSEMSYEELAGQLGYYYKELAAFMTTPAVVHCTDLATLRRRAISPDITNPSFNPYQAQLQLAAELLRLGRRREGFSLLQNLEERLLAKRDRSRNLSCLLWIALLQATAGHEQGAFFLACQITAQAANPAFDKAVIGFFRMLYTPTAFIVQN